MDLQHKVDVNIIKAATPDGCLSLGEEIEFQCPAVQCGGQYRNYYFSVAMFITALSIIGRGKSGLIIGLVLLALAVCAVIFGIRNNRKDCTLIITNMRVICFAGGCGQVLDPYHIRGVHMDRRKAGTAGLKFDCRFYTDHDVAPPFISGPVKMDFADAVRASEAVEKLISHAA